MFLYILELNNYELIFLTMQSRKKTIFFIVALIFTVLMIFLAYDMGSKTTAPWSKKKDLIEKYKVK